MTKMPEPFGYVVDHICDDIRFSKEKPSQPKDALAEVEVEITPVITTAQAEAYANERISDALKCIADDIEQMNPKASLKGIATYVRQLILKEQS